MFALDGRMARMEGHMATAGQTIRNVGSRAQAATYRARLAETAAGAAGARPRHCADCTGMHETVGEASHRRSWRFTLTANASALNPDMKRFMESAVAPDTDGEILNVQLSTADRAVSTRLLDVFVMFCSVRTLERAGDTELSGCGW